MNRLNLIVCASLVIPYSLFGKGSEGSPSISAGVVERQIQTEYNIETLSPHREIPLLEVDIPSEILDIPVGVSAYVKHIVVQREYPLFEDAMRSITSRYENRDLNGRDLVDLCYEIENLYAAHGYILAWVYPPTQRLEDYTLVINVVEGTLNAIQVVGNTSYSTKFIRRYFNHLQGSPINYNGLMKALLLVNENTDLSVQGILRKSEEVGCADLILEVEDRRPLRLSGGYNNWGSSTTTFNQMSSTFTMGNLATSGDKISMMTSFGIPAVFYYLNPSYIIPLTGSGSTLELSYTFSHSNTQGAEYKQYDLASWTELASVTYDQPLVRTRIMEAGINASFNFEQYKNLQQGFTTSYDRLRVLSLGGSIDYTDSISGRNIVSGFLNIGIPSILGGSSVVDPLSSRSGSGGRYCVLTLNGQRIQPLLTDCMFVITANAQGTFNKIPVSVQYVLGGMGTVRGYTASIAVGDVGYCANFEFYFPPPLLKNIKIGFLDKTWGDVLQLLVFLDQGGIYTIDPVLYEDSPAYLGSLGLGFRFYGPRNLSVSFDAGFPFMSQYKQFNSIFYVRLNMDFF
jgi:hemolysin activation/secretion protein